MSERLPALLQRRRRGAAWAVLVIAGICCMGLQSDLALAHGYGTAEGDERVVVGTVGRSDGDLEVSYTHPTTGQDVVAPLPAWTSTPRPGDSVDVVVGADPLAVQLAGDSYGPGTVTDMYVVFGVLALLIVAATWWSLFRLRQLARSRPSGAWMIGVLAAGTGLRRRSVDLHLYRLGSRPGSPPECTVPLAGLVDVGFGRPFRVRVVGTARPLRRVAAWAGPEVLWPRRRALWRSRHPLPAGPEASPTEPRPSGRPTVGLSTPHVVERLRWPILVGVASLFLAVGVAVVTIRHAVDSDHFRSRAQATVAQVTGADDDGMVVLLDVVDSDRRIRINDLLADEFEVGLRYPVLIDSDPDVDGAQFIAFDYDVLEPIVWGAIPLVVAVVWLGAVVGQLWRLRRTASRGPWRERQVVMGLGPRRCVATLVDDGGIGVASVPLRVGASELSPVATRPGICSVIVAGELGPGEPAPMWLSTYEPAWASAPMRVPVPGGDEVRRAGVGSEARTFELSHFWFTRKTPTLTIVDARVELLIPGWFGEETWSIPIEKVGVASPTDGIFDADTVFEDELAVPYLMTRGHYGEANLALVFVSPQRVPPLRWWLAGSGFDWRRSHTSDGTTYDGVLLQADLPDQARDALVEAGAERVDRAATWWSRHRTLVTDPSVRDQAIRRTRLQGVLQLAAWLAFTVALGLSWFVNDTLGWSDVAPVLVAGGVSGVLFLAAFLVRRSSRSVVRKGSRSP